MNVRSYERPTKIEQSKIAIQYAFKEQKHFLHKDRKDHGTTV